MMKNELAVIIPAYKKDFLAQTLGSLADQTCKKFNVYIGDDNSPNDLKAIVDQYDTVLTITYKKFEDNLGSVSLVAQWRRCIEMATENWIWLFSDDDLTDKNCVETFYGQGLGNNPGSLFFKFKSKLINKLGDEILVPDDVTNILRQPFRDIDFINLRLLKGGLRSYAIEYIFSRNLYNELGIVEFPLAWGSDDATWISYASKNGTITLLDAFVHWRMSGQNISNIIGDVHTIRKKIEASSQFIIWLKEFATGNNYHITEQQLLHRLAFQIAPLLFNMNYIQFKKLVKNSHILVSKTQIWYYYFLIKLRYYKNRFRHIGNLVIA